MFQQLSSVSVDLIPAQRRGRQVEEFYANLIGTIALKYAINAGAKNLIFDAIRATQTPGAGQRLRDPTPGTLKADLVAVLRTVETSIPESHPARDKTKPHAERSASALELAEQYVAQFRELRARKEAAKSHPAVGVHGAGEA